ncbi:hypothetical protein AB1E18_005551 [Capra hircus]
MLPLFFKHGITARGPAPPPPTHVTSGPVPARPAPSALRSPPLAVREALRLSRCLRGCSRPVFRVSAAATAGGIRGSPTGLAPSHSRRLSLPPVAATGRGSPVAESLGASVFALLQSPRVLEKRPRPGNGASRFQGLTAEVLIEFCVSSMRNYRLIFCHNLKQP